MHSYQCLFEDRLSWALYSLSLLLLIQKYYQLSKFFVLDFSSYFFFVFFFACFNISFCDIVVLKLNTLHLGLLFQLSAFWGKNLFLRPANLQLLVNDIPI